MTFSVLKFIIFLISDCANKIGASNPYEIYSAIGQKFLALENYNAAIHFLELTSNFKSTTKQKISVFAMLSQAYLMTKQYSKSLEQIRHQMELEIGEESRF